MKHPAPFSDPVIDALRVIIPQYLNPGELVFDPFAGEGIRLGALCDELGVDFAGTDIEEWGGDGRVGVGDSTRIETYPQYPFVVVTSPTYNNGVNDHFAPRESSRRLTYRVALGRELNERNTGRYSGRGSGKAELEYWALSRACVAHWRETVVVNVKDSIRDGAVYPLVRKWRAMLGGFGYATRVVEVGAAGWRYGENGEARVDGEAIIIGTRGG